MAQTVVWSARGYPSLAARLLDWPRSYQGLDRPGPTKTRPRADWWPAKGCTCFVLDSPRPNQGLDPPGPTKPRPRADQWPANGCTSCGLDSIGQGPVKGWTDQGQPRRDKARPVASEGLHQPWARLAKVQPRVTPTSASQGPTKARPQWPARGYTSLPWN